MAKEKIDFGKEIAELKKQIQEQQTALLRLKEKNDGLQEKLQQEKKMFLALNDYMGEDNFRKIIATIESKDVFGNAI